MSVTAPVCRQIWNAILGRNRHGYLECKFGMLFGMSFEDPFDPGSGIHRHSGDVRRDGRGSSSVLSPLFSGLAIRWCFGIGSTAIFFSRRVPFELSMVADPFDLGSGIHHHSGHVHPVTERYKPSIVSALLWLWDSLEYRRWHCSVILPVIGAIRTPCWNSSLRS